VGGERKVAKTMSETGVSEWYRREAEGKSTGGTTYTHEPPNRFYDIWAPKIIHHTKYRREKFGKWGAPKGYFSATAGGWKPRGSPGGLKHIRFSRPSDIQRVTERAGVFKAVERYPAERAHPSPGQKLENSIPGPREGPMRPLGSPQGKPFPRKN